MIYYSRSISGAEAPIFDISTKQMSKNRYFHKKERTEKHKMKKRLLALLLAGLITASLVACSSERGREDDTKAPGGTEDVQSRPDGTQETEPPVTVTWTDVDEYVYVTADNLTLTSVDDGTATVKVSKLDKLHRVKVSNSTRSVVEKDGKNYYAASASLTTADILGENFTTLSKEKTMYAKSAVNIRSYASTADNGNVVAGLKINDKVTVVATGDVGDLNWSKIKVTEDGKTSYYFVSSKYLSDKQVADPNGTDYSQYFTPCEDTTMYVVVEQSLVLRKNAHLDADDLAYLLPDAEVILIATGTVDGMTWSKIKVANEVKPGDPQTYTIGYVNSAYLSPVQGGEEMTLDKMLLLYPSFTKKDTAETMYVSADSLNVRSTPAFPASTDKGNIVAGLKKKDQVKVVATGTVSDTRWAMIEYSEGVFYFVGLSYLTVDPDGNPIPESVDELINKYGFTKLDTAKTYYATGKVNCYATPGTSGTVAKELKANDKVTVYAKGEKDGAEWYLFQVEGSAVYYFAGASLFTESVG